MTLVVDAGARRGDFDLDLQLALAPGETVAVVGPNGAGKSTLVGVLAGLVRPERGSVRLADRTLDEGRNHVPPRERRVGVLFQDRRLFPNLSALENVAFPLRARGVAKEEARAKALAVLERMGMSANPTSSSSTNRSPRSTSPRAPTSATSSRANSRPSRVSASSSRTTRSTR